MHPGLYTSFVARRSTWGLLRTFVVFVKFRAFSWLIIDMGVGYGSWEFV
jgi:hypothetical protein